MTAPTQQPQDQAEQEQLTLDEKLDGLLRAVRDAGATDDNLGAEDWTHSEQVMRNAKKEFMQLIAEARKGYVLPSIPMINGLECPTCGPTLVLGDGGYVTCSYVSCPNPDYADVTESALARAVEEADIRTLETISALLNKDKNQITVIKNYVYNKLRMYKEARDDNRVE